MLNPISELTFSYFIKDGIPTDRALLQKFTPDKIGTHRFNNMKLPLSNNPSDYGDIRGIVPFPDFNRHLTLPSLAMRIFRTHFMPKNTIYQLIGNVDANIRNAYSGGAVDSYIPHNRIGDVKNKILQKLYYYDANSLYPFIMSKIPMLVGMPTWFEGDIRQYEPDAVGVFYCKITSPTNLLHPILQRRIQTVTPMGGIRTIAGLGSWEGWIVSGEMDNAMNYGYSFKILKGYQFKEEVILNEYITKLYNLRQEYDKSHPLNLIAKLLMNSLYGKFGMSLKQTKVDIINVNTETGKAEAQFILDTHSETINDYVVLDENTVVISRDTLAKLKYNEKEDMYHGQDVNIAIAATITAGARMYMSNFKNNPDYNLYYSDTDSIVIDKALSPELIGNKLGFMKLEHIIERAVFLAPKVYGLIVNQGNELIKVKGISSDVVENIHIQDLEALLAKDSSREFTQEKWNKQVLEGQISIADVAYTLKVTSNKREAIYVNNVFSNTKPYNYDELSPKDR